MTELSWDLQALLILVVLSGVALAMVKLGPLLVGWIHRLIWWHRVKPYSACYITYRQNVRVLR